MRRWLEDFPLRVAPGPDRFLLAALLVVAVALTTVGWQSFRAARADPVDTIRHE
jgi:putative ABC transport system permease protein